MVTDTIIEMWADYQLLGLYCLRLDSTKQGSINNNENNLKKEKCTE